MKGLEDYFPIWNKLTASERERLTSSAALRSVPAGTLLHSGGGDCMGLLVIRSGQLRAYILSPEGKEVTIYRLFERDICLFSAACMLRSIQFDISIEAEKETEFWVIPPEVYKQIMESSAVLAGYTNELMADRFSEVMWLVEQILWRSIDKRLAAFLLTERDLEGSDQIHITHERIASHLGTAREVVTRMLRYFQSEGLVSLSRGSVRLTEISGLEALAK